MSITEGVSPITSVPFKRSAKPQRLRFHMHENGNGSLCVYESGELVPFDIQRVFTVSARVGDIRGEHAHKKCTQLLVCVHGGILVTCDDGSSTTQFALESMSDALLIPPGIWAKEQYVADAVLMVLCDRLYEPEDYLRDYGEFKAFLGSIGQI